MTLLTRYALESYVQGGHERHEMTADPGGKWYAKDEADAVIRELEAENERLGSIASHQADRIAELEAELAQLRITAEVASRHLMRERDAAWAERDAARAANSVKVSDMMEALYRTYLSLTAGDSYDAERYMRQEFWRRMAIAAIDAARNSK